MNASDPVNSDDPTTFVRRARKKARRLRSNSREPALALEKLPIGAAFGPANRFIMGETLGRGGVATVREAIDVSLNRKVAIKTLRGDLKHAEQSLQLEALALSRLHHPHIVQLHDIAEHGEEPFLVMERLEGPSLQSILEHGKAHETRLLELLLDVTDALEHAHSRGVLHLDLKPANVMLDSNGRATVVDFGVGAAIWAKPEGAKAPHSACGTPQYMAPEQWDVGMADTRTDIWSLGVMVYEAMLGKLPPTVPERDKRSKAVGSPAQDSSPPHRVSRTLAAVIQRALEADPARRFQTIAEFRAALDRALQTTSAKTVSETQDSVRLLGAAVHLLGPRCWYEDLRTLTGLAPACLEADLCTLTERHLVRQSGWLLLDDSQTASFHSGAFKPLGRSFFRCCFEAMPPVVRDRLWNTVLCWTLGHRGEASRATRADP